MIFLVIAASFSLAAVDAQATSWNTWSSCTGTCGTGKMYRERVILIPNQNDSCYGTVTEKKTCNDKSCTGLVNLAINKPAAASSKFMTLYPPDNAVDGVTKNSLQERSCMHTNKDSQPWLRIILHQPRLIEKVVIYNRGDCCSERLNNVVVWVGNHVTATSNVICGERDNMENVNRTVITCHTPTIAQYVYVTIPGPQYLHVCEVEVLGRPLPVKDLAVGKKCYHSTTNGTNSPTLAVDGNPSTYAITNNHVNSWWKVYLGGKSYVTKVIMKYNTKPLNAVVMVEGETSTKVCGLTGNLAGTVTVTCPTTMIGHSVKIQLLRKDQLILSEVNVMGIQ